MGAIKFLAPRRDRFAPDAVERAYFSGLDEIPWQTRTRWTDDGLVVERSESDSGNFFIPAMIAGHGEIMLSTASLMERARPYHLHVELARGTLNRLRNQIAASEAMGVTLPAGLKQPLRTAYEQLSRAVTSQSDPRAAAEEALSATHAALDGIALLIASQSEQILAARHQQGGKLNTLLGCNLGSARPADLPSKELSAAFNTALVPLLWRDVETREGDRDWTLSDQQIEWCRAQGLRVCAGPLLQIDKWSLPDWMYLWGEDDEENFRSCVAEHIEAVVTRYRGKVQLWQCAAGLNINNDFNHGEEARLRLAVLSIETIRRVDPRAPIVISIDQPWGSFMSREDCDLSPLHFADALVRADLGLAGIGLEINLGYAPQGSEPRDALEIGRQMDRWGALGMPLLVSLTIPSGNGPDPLARSGAKVLNFAEGGVLTPASQRDLAGQIMPALLTRQPVQGILWNQLLESQPHRLPHSGLYDAANQAKPLLPLLADIRRKHLV